MDTPALQIFMMTNYATPAKTRTVKSQTPKAKLKYWMPNGYSVTPAKAGIMVCARTLLKVK